MSQLIDVRIDKYLWAVRFFKTRTLASDQIENGKVKLFDLNIKSSKKIKVNDIIWVRKPEAHYKIKVLKIVEKRVSAPIAIECYELIEKINLNIPKVESSFFNSNIFREKGSGRPTKKDRRDIDNFT